MQSEILESAEIQKLHSLLANHWKTLFIDWELLYSGVSSAEFYENCCSAPQTLCVIEARNMEGKINVFGGYTSQKWENPVDGHDFTYSCDPNAFLYLIRSSCDYPPAVYPILEDKKDTAIGNHKGYMCFFGKV